MGRAGVQRGDPVAWQRLAGFRAGWYGCLGPWGDALFGLTGAVACAGGPVTSLPGLSLLPVFGRGHGRAYAALAGGQVDGEGLRDLLAAARPPLWPLVFAAGGTSWPRCEAETSPLRGYYDHPSRHSAGKPIVAGWWYQQVSRLNFDNDCWAWPAGCRRIPPAKTTSRPPPRRSGTWFPGSGVRRRCRFWPSAAAMTRLPWPAS